jgi:hypothetical protein
MQRFVIRILPTHIPGMDDRVRELRELVEMAL